MSDETKRPEWVRIVDGPQLAVTHVGGHEFGSVVRVLRWKSGCPVVRSGPLQRGRAYDVTLLSHAWEPADPPEPSPEPLTVEIDGRTYIERSRELGIGHNDQLEVEVTFVPAPLTLDDLARIYLSALAPGAVFASGTRRCAAEGLAAVLAAIGHDLGSPVCRKAER